MSDINIKEHIPDPSSQFNIKRFRIGNRNFEIPEKTVDVRTINQDFQKIVTNKDPILEKSKLIKKFEQIDKIMDSESEKQIDDFFYNKKWTNNFFKIINLTFAFNPFEATEKDLKKLDPFMEYLWSHSKNILTIPNISKKIIDLKSYISFVDYSYEFLNSMKSKPIFVPLSINFGMKDLMQLIDHYIKKEYYYIWVDFEGKAINSNTSARLRRIFRILNDKKIFDKFILYYTNIKREILSNIKSDNSGSSDILASIGGANMIGINREPQRFNPNAPPQSRPDPKEVWKHKARFFDKDTYYYKKFETGRLEPKNINITKNTSRLQEELKIQTEVFIKNYKIKDYIEGKPITKENPILFKNILN